MESATNLSGQPPSRIRELRKAAGLSLQDLGKSSGIHFSNLAQIEKGNRDAKLWHLQKLGKALNVLPADLLNFEHGGLAADERALIQTYREIPPEMRVSFDALRQAYQTFRGSEQRVGQDASSSSTRAA